MPHRVNAGLGNPCFTSQASSFSKLRELACAWRFYCKRILPFRRVKAMSARVAINVLCEPESLRTVDLGSATVPSNACLTIGADKEL